MRISRPFALTLAAIAAVGGTGTAAVAAPSVPSTQPIPMESPGDAAKDPGEDVEMTTVPAEQGERAEAEAPGEELPSGDALAAEDPNLDGVAARSIEVGDQQMVGVKWDGESPDRVELRTQADDGSWSDWMVAEIALAEDGTATGTEPLWVGDTSQAEVRASRDGADATDEVELVLIRTPVAETDDDADAAAPAGSFSPSVLPLAPTSTGISAPEVVSRAGWGANEALTSDSPRYADRTDAVVIHHTAGSNSYSESEAPSIIRGYLAYHTQTLGWDDLGYNVLVDRYGNIYEGRAGGLSKSVIGAHARGSNTGTFGIAMMGHNSDTPPTQAQLDAVADITAWKLGGSFHFDPTEKVTVNGKSQFRIFAHRDAAGNSTACPGDMAYAALPGLRSAVADRTAEAKTELWQYYRDTGGEAEYGDVTQREHLQGNERVIEFSSGKSLHLLPGGSVEARQDGGTIDEGEAPERVWRTSDFGPATLHLSGADGSYVRTLQEALRLLGGTLEVDGKFGYGTEAAVRDFQSSAGIMVDGRVGPGTKATLVEQLNALDNASEPAPDETDTPGEGEWTSGDFGAGTVYRGKSGEAVQLLQSALNEYGYSIEVDGWFGQGTERAVKAFQLHQGLAADGRVGPQTKSALVTEMNGFVSSWAPAASTAATPSDTWQASDFNPSTLYHGVRAGSVPQLQRALNELGEDLIVDGVFGRKTLDAVVDFQRGANILVDGRVGPATKATLVDQLEG